MKTLVAVRPALARRMGQRFLLGNHIFLDDVGDAVELRRHAHREQAGMMILDVGLGGRRWRAMDAAEAVAKICPIVIAVAEVPAEGMIQEVANAGCCGLVDVAEGSWPSDLTKVMARAMSAYRLAPVLPRRRAALLG